MRVSSFKQEIVGSSENNEQKQQVGNWVGQKYNTDVDPFTFVSNTMSHTRPARPPIPLFCVSHSHIHTLSLSLSLSLFELYMLKKAFLQRTQIA